MPTKEELKTELKELQKELGEKEQRIETLEQKLQKTDGSSSGDVKALEEELRRKNEKIEDLQTSLVTVTQITGELKTKQISNAVKQQVEESLQENPERWE